MTVTSGKHRIVGSFMGKRTSDRIDRRGCDIFGIHNSGASVKRQPERRFPIHISTRIEWSMIFDESGCGNNIFEVTF